MVSRRVKLIKRLLQALDGAAPLSTNKGKHVSTPRYISPKDRRHSGWVTPAWPKHPKMKYKEAIQEALEPQDFWDEWQSIKDGQRDYTSDASHFKKNIPEKYFAYVKEWAKPSHINKKLMKELRIRRAAKAKKKIRTS